jgi:hypothetical protein
MNIPFSSLLVFFHPFSFSDDLLPPFHPVDSGGRQGGLAGWRWNRYAVGDERTTTA